MKTFQIVTLFCLIAASMAFAPNKAPVAQRFAESGFDLKKAAVAAIPAAIATPAFAADSIVASLPTETLSLEVQFGAYLAVLLGTLLPVLFLVNLYVQTESRKAGRDGGIDAE
mmetsp:Transcript_33858/g.72205  ORF Transcript_33858/g.72205 Transcript_33858/m.72205 type:complete len:113 (+) Transcript_33858:100-438(+)|eukprot:CAMPEP_0172527686 /NCGR_PEP_ID=MMETSP1067-20121228/2315_1 /TAXON_ID=265564 ORGANISM="Thalassiosira punctigera, Strain Tpunct2005C2" /NCGR_SAMPLE_ID=MMETSP1067 /ASSEMBLY_ACC=CAM_ASM_000444 /LENGTH=112 /DNA_ID=CAMNT_0013311479 /DNA_START=100 /DNA_END=438 /DNA_ORIENTATION=-